MAAMVERMSERTSGAIIRSTFAVRTRTFTSKRRRIKDMKKRTLILATSAIMAVLIAVPFAYAQHMRGAHGGHRMGGELGPVMMLGHLEHAKQALGLSDQQVADIKAIFQDLHAQNATYRDQLHGNLKSVAETLIANPNDIAAAQALLAKQEAAEHTMKV